MLRILYPKLMTYISDLKYEIIYLKEIIIGKLKDANIMFANKFVILEDKIKNLEIQSNNQDQYIRRNKVKESGIPEIVNSKNRENAVVDIFSATDAKISSSDIEVSHHFSTKKKILRFDLQIENIAHLLCATGKNESPLTMKKKNYPSQDFLSVKISLPLTEKLLLYAENYEELPSFDIFL